jgi:hypothetical protein
MNLDKSFICFAISAEGILLKEGVFERDITILKILT